MRRIKHQQPRKMHQDLGDMMAWGPPPEIDPIHAAKLDYLRYLRKLAPKNPKEAVYSYIKVINSYATAREVSEALGIPIAKARKILNELTAEGLIKFKINERWPWNMRWYYPTR